MVEWWLAEMGRSRELVAARPILFGALMAILAVLSGALAVVGRAWLLLHSTRRELEAHRGERGAWHWIDEPLQEPMEESDDEAIMEDAA